MADYLIQITSPDGASIYAKEFQLTPADVLYIEVLTKDSYQVRTVTGRNNLKVHSAPGLYTPVIDKLTNGSYVWVYPPAIKKDGYTWGKIDSDDSGRWIALEYTEKIE